MAYRRTEQVEARFADKRALILAAARTMVSEGGWVETHISHVASSAGVATGSVYRYFPSKADLFVEVLSTVSQREVDVLQAIADSEDSPYQNLHVAVSSFVKRAMRNRRLAYALIAEPCDKELEEARLVYRHAISQQIMRIVKAGQERADFRPDIDPTIAATVIVGGFMESLIGPLSPLNADFMASGHPASQAVHDLANQIADVCCAAVLPHKKVIPLTPRPRRLK
jgi:AcrR family transcriptional regulator